MKKKIVVLVGSVAVIVVASFLILRHDHRSSPQPQQTTPVAEAPRSLPEPDDQTEDQSERLVEDKDQPEYTPAVWNHPAASRIAPHYRTWSKEENPSLGELPDSLQWNYFVPRGKRGFRASEKNALATNGFFFEEIAPLSQIGIDDMTDLYGSHRSWDYGRDYSMVPLFITSDYLLHAYHLVMDRMLQQAEERKLFFRLKEFTLKLISESEGDLGRLQAPSLRQASLKNLAFFSVPMKLLDTTFVVKAEVRDEVEAELQHIRSASGFEMSPNTGLNEDYSQYKPRGHYTKTKRLSDYFQAMMWYGRQAFTTESKDLTLRAILLVRSLGIAEVRGLWQSISRPIDFLIESADDFTLADYEPVVLRVFGKSPSEDNLLDQTKIANFATEVGTLRVPQISGRPLANRLDPKSIERGFRIFGQRAIPDSRIFNDLTSPRVGNDSRPRNMPTALDIMGVLGSSEATEMLKLDSGIPGYREAFNRLKTEYASLPDRTWTKTVYWNWLNTLRPLLEEKGMSYPFFMRSKGWRRKSLLTAVASWSELRHDTMLYSKQSYAEQGEGGEEEVPPQPPQPKSYVEPDLEFFNRFIDLIQTTAWTMSDQKLLSDEYFRKLSLLFDRAKKLRAIAQKELLNENIDKAEYDFLLECATDFGANVLPDEMGDIVEQKHKQMALVADVHTDAFDGTVLEVGVGSPQRIYVAVKDKSGGTRVCVGYVYSFYEFQQPMNQRLTDDEWKAMIYPTVKPEVKSKEPEWIRDLRTTGR